MVLLLLLHGVVAVACCCCCCCWYMVYNIPSIWSSSEANKLTARQTYFFSFSKYQNIWFTNSTNDRGESNHFAKFSVFVSAKNDLLLFELRSKKIIKIVCLNKVWNLFVYADMDEKSKWENIEKGIHTEIAYKKICFFAQKVSLYLINDLAFWCSQFQM